MSPLPLYLGTSGYAHNGRVRPGDHEGGTSLFTTFAPVPRALAITESGAFPVSTHVTRASNRSNWSHARPPPQWAIPGTIKRRAKSEAEFPWYAWNASYQLTVSATEKIPSAVPCATINFVWVEGSFFIRRSGGVINEHGRLGVGSIRGVNLRTVPVYIETSSIPVNGVIKKCVAGPV